MSNHTKETNVSVPKKRSIWFVWLSLGVVVAVYLAISFIGNVLVIGMKLGTMHPVIEWIFYGGLIALFVWFMIIPLFRVLNFPQVSLEDINDEKKISSKVLKKIAQKLVDSKVLAFASDTKIGSDKEQKEWKELLKPENEGELKERVSNNSELLNSIKKMILMELREAGRAKGALRTPVSMAIALQKALANKIIHEHALLVFVSTAISQNGRLDAVAVLVANFRLVKDLVNHFGYRPPLPTLIKIYAQIFMVALVADEVDDINVANLLEESAPALFKIIPGTSIIINSALNGVFNAILTLRIGFVAKKYLLNIGRSLNKKEIRKQTNQEAIKEFKSVRNATIKMLPDKIKVALGSQ